jgi:hypothetical protein
MSDAQNWAAHIRRSAPNVEVETLIRAINVETRTRRARRGAVIVACAQVLAQCIAGEPEISREVRLGIIALIDGFAMQMATADPAP